MSWFVRTLVRSFPAGPYAQLKRALRKPALAQRKALRGLLQQAVQTEWGIRHGFADVLRAPDLVAAYQQRVPLATYEDVREDLERMLRREPNVLWPGLCNYAAVSGGTSSRGQLFPISDDLLRENVRYSLAAMLSRLALTGDTAFLKGKILTLCGSAWPHPDYPGVLVGEISGVLNHHSMQGGKKKPPSWMVVPPDSPSGQTWNDKITSLVDHAMDLDVRMLACAASWGVVMLRRLLERYQERYGRQVSTIGEIWPNFKLINAGGVPLRTYRAALDELIGLPGLEYQESYGATQAFLAFQTDSRDPALQLWLGSKIFYEFVPLAEHGKAGAARLTVDRVQPDTLYVPYITTCSGLWSYCLDDVVRFSSVDPPKLFVVGRIGEMLDTVGEEVIREQVQESLEIARRETDANLSEYHLAPLPASSLHGHGHQLFVEFERAPQNLAQFTATYDRALQEINASYRKWRTERGFSPPDVVTVPPGTFQRWMLESRGEVRGQSKILRLREDRVMADALLELAGAMSHS